MKTTGTRQKLIDTSLELIWTSSYGSVSVDDICEAAGVKKGSFYHFFPSKVDLAIAAMEESFASFRSSYDAIFSPATAPMKRFEKLADALCEHQSATAARYGKVCGCPLASLGSEMAGHEPRIRAAFGEISCRYERYFENALRDMVADKLLPKTTDVKRKAQELYTYLLGQVMIARIRNDLAPLKRDLKSGLLRIVGAETKVSGALEGRAPARRPRPAREPRPPGRRFSGAA